jgi:hypothetical protein
MPSRDTTVVRPLSLLHSALFATSILIHSKKEDVQQLCSASVKEIATMKIPAAEEAASVVCEMLWHAAASEGKRVALRCEKGFMDFKKGFENR